MLDRFIGRKKKIELIPILPPPGGADAQYLFAQSISRSASTKNYSNAAVKAKPELKANQITSHLPITNDLTKLKSVSISSITTKINETQTDIYNDTSLSEAENNTVTTPLDTQKFYETWIVLCNNLKQQGKESLYVTLTARKPELLENGTIQLNIDNKTQQQAIERDKTYLLDFLREKLNNHQITIVTNIDQSNDAVALYTNKDKFKRLAEKNPLLIELQKRLNLDID